MSEIVTAPELPDMLQEGTEPETLKRGTEPDGMQNGTKPVLLQSGTEPELLQNETKPDTMQKGTEPFIQQNGSKPDMLQSGTESGMVQNGSKPNMMQNGTDPGVLQNVTEPVALQNAKEPDMLHFETEPEVLQNESKPDIEQNVRLSEVTANSGSQSVSSHDERSLKEKITNFHSQRKSFSPEGSQKSAHTKKKTKKKGLKKEPKKTVVAAIAPPLRMQHNKGNKDKTSTSSQKPMSNLTTVSSRTIPRSGSARSVGRSVPRSVSARSVTSSRSARSTRSTISRKSVPNLVSAKGSKESSRRQSRVSYRARFSKGYPFDLMSVDSSDSMPSVISTTSSRVSSVKGRKSKRNELISKNPEPYKIYYLKHLQNLAEETPAISEADPLHFDELSESLDNLEPISSKSSKRPSPASRKDTEEELPSIAESLIPEDDDAEEDIQELRYNFLQQFRRVPKIEELSSSSSVEVPIYTKKESIRKKQVSMNTLVDFRESTALEESTDWHLEAEAESAKYSGSSSQISEISLSSLTDSDIEVIVEGKSSVEDVSRSMMKIEPRHTRIDYDGSTSSSLEYRMHVATLEAVENFLDTMINQIVDLEEHPDAVLRRYLDKKRLHKRLAVLAQDYQEEIYKNQSLDRLVTEYYARRKVLPFITESKRTQTMSQMRHRAVLEELDYRLEYMRALNATKKKLIAKLREEELAAEAVMEEKKRKFESKVKETLLKDGFDRLKGVIDDIMKKMNRTRDEVSAVRRNLLYIQHRYAMFSTLAEKMECTDGGLSVNAYLSNQAHNHSLLIKIQGHRTEASQ
ncbi:uncharacterized protein Dana_GF15112, isoform C [Drosophila ananassae]|uniref:Uncharacterized protein, isoform C n=1 Tax=Drosophila ananassae TaxID=7217 RepID=A0A0N8NZ27_DROAN|nr:uncharacterized protein LOC6497925 isoform X2 [Drosophila ananassae]KPU73156.1 uncharacterized protein Dana_GF15112, isoform C [Drosophila ananassae]